MVCLPDASGESLPDRSRFAECVANDQKLATRILLIPAYFTTFAVSLAMFLRDEPLYYAAGVAMGLFFLGGLIAHNVIVSRRERFLCRQCGVNLRMNSPYGWTQATGRCGDCAHPALECHEPSAAAKRFNRNTLRKRVQSRKQYLLYSLAATMAVTLTTLVFIRLFGGIPIGGFLDWAILAIHPAFAVAVLYRKFASKQDTQRTCPLCDKSISDTYDVVAATGRCPQCFGHICA